MIKKGANRASISKELTEKVLGKEESNA